jgi:hypothetical protein
VYFGGVFKVQYTLLRLLKYSILCWRQKFLIVLLLHSFKVKCLTSLVESWEDIEEYTKWCRYGSYQTRGTADGVEVRVTVGRFGYVQTFREKDDPLLERVIRFCKAEGFIKVLGNVPDELFFAAHRET